VRNHVVILPVDDISNAAAEGVARNIVGTMAIPHPYGRLQFGADLELHFRTLIGTGSNPNVAAVVVIGIEPAWTKRVVDGIAKTGKPVEGFAIEHNGDHATIMNASKKAKEFVHYATALHRTEAPLKDLWVSTKCGESDTTSGCGANPTVGNAFDKLYPQAPRSCSVDDRAHRRREPSPSGADAEVKEKFMMMFNRYLEAELPQDERPLRTAADHGQHRRRPPTIGRGARQHPEDRQEGLRRRDRRPRRRPAPLWFMIVVGRGRRGDALRPGPRRPLLP
jgi:(2R)-sulfolactate sulfo-lyase subunit beta